MHYKTITLILLVFWVLAGCSDNKDDSKATVSVVSTSVQSKSKTSIVNTNDYIATLSEGINFGQPGYPSFLENVAGMSGHEQWGRWSDGKEVIFYFKEPLPLKFELNIKGTVLSANAERPIPVKIGQWVGELQMAAEAIEKAKNYTLHVENTDHAKEIHITIPNPSPPGTGDVRKLGIGFISLKIEVIN